MALKDVSYATTRVIAERLAHAARQWDERQQRQEYANWRVQTVQRNFGGALTFAQLLREFRNAGNDYDQGHRRGEPAVELVA